MQISKKVTLNNKIYYIFVDVEFQKNENNIPILCLKDYKDKYWDGGDLSLLIEKIEQNYKLNIKKFQNNDFISDIIYIYERIPFLIGIKDAYISEKDNTLYSEAYISKEEIEKYIKDFHIEIINNINFKLYDARTWYI